MVPPHEVVERGDLAVQNAREGFGEPGLRVGAVELGGLDQRVGGQRRQSAVSSLVPSQLPDHSAMSGKGCLLPSTGIYPKKEKFRYTYQL